MTNFVDTAFNKSATGGVMKYNIIHEDSTSELIQMNIATPVQTQGTALNKVFFDTIQTDLTSLSNNKLNVSNKASQADVLAGSNDTKYITPYALNSKITKLNVTGSCTTITAPPHNTDIFDFGAYPDKTILITGTMKSANNSLESANFCRLNVYNSSTSYQIADCTNNGYATSFYIYVDNKYKILKMEKLTQNGDTTSASGTTVDTKLYRFSNLQKLNMIYNGTNTTYDLTFLILD